jgi:DNA invertase Pin-like site-specific DNA recombinase
MSTATPFAYETRTWLQSEARQGPNPAGLPQGFRYHLQLAADRLAEPTMFNFLKSVTERENKKVSGSCDLFGDLGQGRIGTGQGRASLASPQVLCARTKRRRMNEAEKTPRRSGKKTRCAIYTRKSTDEGLEQAFNSLDAQREACAAFIQSQKHEGWTVSPTLYDDGGLSGGTLERRALQRLLADIEAGQIDVIVVYKVDRLTRALSDFAKLVEIFDRRGVSFVSITQQFNTTTSMGRLTLNVLLSFAQFEREVIGERVRDKIAASKKKGMWMGGMPPLGYDVKDRKLVVNDEEARTVVSIYWRYLALKSVRALKSGGFELMATNTAANNSPAAHST